MRDFVGVALGVETIHLVDEGSMSPKDTRGLHQSKTCEPWEYLSVQYSTTLSSVCLLAPQASEQGQVDRPSSPSSAQVSVHQDDKTRSKVFLNQLTHRPHHHQQFHQ